jgi:hypothetical protein
MTLLHSSTGHAGSTSEHQPTAATGILDVHMDIGRVIDPQGARRLAQVLFSGSTGVTVASSTGVA